MAVDEQYLRIRRSLEEKLGVEEAFYLMDRPAGGWSELVTNQTLGLQVGVLDEQFRSLDARFDAIDARFEAMDARFEAMDARFEAMDARFEAIDARFEAMDTKFSARFDTIDARFDALRSEFTAELQKGLRDQTWKLVGALVASMAGLLALLGAILAATLQT